MTRDGLLLNKPRTRRTPNAKRERRPRRKHPSELGLKQLEAMKLQQDSMVTFILGEVGRFFAVLRAVKLDAAITEEVEIIERNIGPSGLGHTAALRREELEQQVIRGAAMIDFVLREIGHLLGALDQAMLDATATAGLRRLKLNTDSACALGNVTVETIMAAGGDRPPTAQHVN